MRALLKLISKRKLLAIFFLIMSTISIIVTLWWNKQLSIIIDVISIGSVASKRNIDIAIITVIVNAILAYAVSIISAWLCESLSHELRMGMARNFLGRSIHDIENINSGEELSKLQNEANDISAYLNNNLSNIASDLIRFLGTFSFLLYINLKLTLLINLPVLLIIIYIFFSSKIISTAVNESQESQKRLNRFADILFTLFPIIKIFEASKIINDNYIKELKTWEKHTKAAERKRAILMSLSGLLTLVPLVLLVFIGGTMVIKDTLSLGTLYLFINLSGNVSGVMMNMPGHISAFRVFTANINRLRDSTDIEDEVKK